MMVFFNFFIKTISFFTAVLFFFILLGLLITYAFPNIDNTNKRFSFKEGDKNSQNTIVLIELRGPILSEPLDSIEFNIIDSLEAIYVSEFINSLKEIEILKPKGIIISINSPGGSVSATYDLYTSLKKFKKNNQIKIFLHTNELLASGGYWVALASDKIYASYGAMIGSIGVRGPEWIYYDNPVAISTGIFGEAIKTKGGIKKYNTIAGRSKDLFNSFRKPTKDESDSLQEIVNGIYNDFVNAVTKNRSIENKFVINEIGALIFDSKKAKENFLIDDIINLPETTKKIVKDLKLKDYKILKLEQKKGFFAEFFKSSLMIRYDSKMIKQKRICSLVNSYINVLFLDSKFISNC